jgi:hypothetical protein
MTLERRLHALEQRNGRPDGPCPGGTTVIVEPGAPTPEDAATCPICGQPHVLIVEEVIVEAEGQTP